VLDLHNVESALHASCAEAERWPLSLAHRRFAQAYIREERRWLPRFSSILAASEADAGRVRGRSLSTPVDVYPNALPFSPVPLVEEENAIGFSANFEYQPNIAAVRFLVREIWPSLHRRFPELKLRLIGKNPHAVSKLTRGVPNLEITGPVAEAIPEIARLKIAIVPLLSGSGTRIKILEAWAAARPTVSTSIGAEGLDRGPGRELVIADGAERFIEAVAQLLGSLERRRRIGCAARLRYEEEFTWEKAWQRLKLV